MTTPQRWQEIDRIFAAALDREPGERAQFLAEACAGDDELRKEVESLLANDSPESFAAPAVEEATRLISRSEEISLKNKSIGPYRIVRSLGAGGMGHVYLAHDSRLNRPVAVKLLSFYDAAEHERIRRFRQEALAASALNHPNILTIYEIGEFENQNFIVTEFVEGETLQQKIQRETITNELAVEIAIQVASALAAAHSAAIVHRDIKPANIMVRPDGLVKVLDFGVAKYIRPDDRIDQDTLLQTAPGSIVGTASYMSPEQARGVLIDARSDIWSLGVIFYEMIAGRRPFMGDTSMDVLSAVIDRHPTSFSQLGLTVPDQLERVVLKALQKDRELRYQSANEVLNDLKELKKYLELGLQPEPSRSKGEKPPSASIAVMPFVNMSKDRENDSAEKVDTRLTDKSKIEAVTNKLNAPAQTEVSEQRRLYSKRNLVLVVLFLAIAAVVGTLAYRSFRSQSLAAKSIAVLPFKNESGNSELEYLSDGMTDSLINSLSQLPQVTVKAHTSVFRYKKSDIDPQRIASELSVEAILNGRVVQRGDDITLYLWLVDASNGNQVWGEQYQRKLADLSSLQKEIARDVAEKLRLKFSGAAEQRVSKDYTANAEAYRLYLLGRFHVFKLTPIEVEQGLTSFEKAIELDPNYALAYVGISEANRSLALGSERPPEYLLRAKAAAQKALQLDEELAEAHTAYGATLFWLDRNWTEAEKQYHRALDLNPNNMDAHMFYAHLLSNTGRHNEALAEIERARQIDPLSPFLGSLQLQFLIYAGKSDDALSKLPEVFALAPNFWFSHHFASLAYIQKGMLPDAVKEAHLATELSGAQTVSAVSEGYALAKMGRRDEARAILDKLLALSKQRFVPPYHIAFLYNALGEREETLKWLESGLEVRDPKLGFLKVEPGWNNLREDPQFQEIMKRAGF